MPEKIPLGESSQINVYILIPILALFFNENNVFICISSLCASTNLACEKSYFSHESSFLKNKLFKNDFVCCFAQSGCGRYNPRLILWDTSCDRNR